METLGAALSAIQSIVLVLLLVATAGWGIRLALRRRRRLVMINRIEALGEVGLMGFEVGPGGSEGLEGLTLISPDVPTAPPAVRLDTSRSETPVGLRPLDLGVRALDARLVARAASDGARRGLNAARSGVLQVAGDFFEGWAARFTRISVADNRVHFTFAPNQVHRLEEVLPQLAWLAKALLSATWWLPPSELTRSDASAFRGGAEVAASAAVWYLEVPCVGRVDRVGPVSLERIIALLQSGRISWLTRVSMESDGTLAPLQRLPSLQSICFATQKEVPAVAESSKPHKSPRVRSGGRRLFDFLQYDFMLLLLLGLMSIANCQAGGDFLRAARGEQSVRWPTTPAEIVHSRVSIRESDDSTYYWPDIRYSYQVGGRELTGTRWRYRYVWRFDGFSADRELIEQAVARYRVGNKVRVAYDPSDPSESVLEPGRSQVELVSGVIKASFLGVSILLLIGAVIVRRCASRARRRARRAMCVESGT